MRTSMTHPLRIDSLPLGAGRIGMTLCPGKTQVNGVSGAWARDLDLDLASVSAFGATALVSLLESHELESVRVSVAALESKARALGIDWFFAPIRDQGVPDDAFEAVWSYVGPRMHRRLQRGERIVLHCMGGLGRTGIVAARLLVESGTPPEQAIQAVRAARRHTIETVGQEEYVRACTPAVAYGPNLTPWERALGCVLGGAVGDAFGYAVEFDRLASIRSRFGPLGIREPVLQNGRLIVSDDTQMTLFTLEGLLHASQAEPADDLAPLAHIRAAYLDWYGTQGRGLSGRSPVGSLALESSLRVPRAPGTTCLSALARGGGGSIVAPINDSKGCGGVMRVAPVGLFPGRLDTRAAFRLGAESAALTHGHPSGYLSAGAMAAIVRLLLDGVDLRDAATQTCDMLTAWDGHAETLAAVRAALDAAAHPTDDHAAAVRALGQGWVGEEALSVGLYAALVAKRFADALAIAANHDGDSDSTASIAGQLWGAWHGLESIPHAWVAALDVLAPTLRLARRWDAMRDA